ncbi:MAG: hypothetical protein R3321_00325 [Nitrososphaeraceae archaeon]|nr:hypothetical protein [Nitrososphaeraceae archaeon]
MVPFTLRLNEENHQTLTKIKEKTGLSMNAIMNMAINNPAAFNHLKMENSDD